MGISLPRLLMVVRMRGGRLDSEHVDVQMGGDLIAHADTVPEQIKEGKDLAQRKINTHT